jgi:hypothetical protein
MRLIDESPQKAARIAGVLYLVIVAGGIFAEAIVRQSVFVSGDPAATARNILENELLYRLGFAVHLTYLACALTLAVIFYGLFRRVNGTLALLALFFNAVAIAVESVNLLNHFGPLHLLRSTTLGEPQAQALASVSLRLFASGFGISLVFFGFFCLLMGRLIQESGFFPRALGVLMTVAGVCYLINSYAVFIVPAFGARQFPFILLPCLIGELSFALWLLVKGVDVRRWEGARNADSTRA